MKEKISVIGAGSWGTAISKLLAEKGFDVLIWAFEARVAEGINKSHLNPLYLSDVNLPKSLGATNDIKKAIKGRNVIISAVPSHALRGIWSGVGDCLESDALLVSCTKGIEAESLKLMSQILSDCLPKHPTENRAVLSGPSFAREVAAGLPTSVVIAGKDISVCRRFQEIFRTDTFLIFTNDDVVGVEVGGAVKNVIAIAAGVSDGLLLGHNSRAAIITRGLYEMIKIGRALGANPLTFAGLSGIGDLILTCTAELSRNHSVGKELGLGHKLSEVLKGMNMVAEGVSTAKAVHMLAKKYGINAPICDAMYKILYEKFSPKQAVVELCALPLGDELGSIQNLDPKRPS